MNTVHEYLDAGLRELGCHSCGARVLVKKLSVHHTSVQWTVEAAGQCTEFAALGELRPLLQGCATLRAGIEQAVRDGRLAVPTAEP